MIDPETATSERQRAFMRRLQASEAAVDAVNSWLRRRGNLTYVPRHVDDPQWRPTEDHVDAGDIFIILDDGSERRIEVKNPRISFTCLQDWPFRREMFLTNAKAVRRWPDDPLAHVIVNSALTHAAIVAEKTRPRWFRRNVYMRNVGREEDTWIVDPVLAQFVRLADD